MSKKILIAVGALIGILLIGTYYYEYEQKKEADKEAYQEYMNPYQEVVNEGIKTYDEVTDELKEVSNLLMESNITGNLTTCNKNDPFTPTLAQQSGYDTYYTCYNKGETYYVIKSDVGWIIVGDEE